MWIEDCGEERGEVEVERGKEEKQSNGGLENKQ